ncbi:MAG: deoxynucleoside kinase [Saprospiraceae bacterium]|nr:deoxynucleoside kinase [Bacteroidia bacterium]NNF20353.1 deoxynucleoside kinase [Saprospiraceae bacterium]NNK89761.1 deoxynucleoside kinase [Saprospiraceae bacterium]
MSVTIPYKYICIEGNIGSGKTSLVDMLCHDINGRPLLEQFGDNPFLPLFYQNPERYAFTVELFFMTERFKQLQNLNASPDLFTDYIIADFSFIKTQLFARKNLQEEEYRLFQMLFSVLNNSFTKPDILVYLHRDVDYLIENIKERNRHYELDMKPDYLKRIQDSYFEYIRNITSFPVLILDLKDLDFVGDEKVYETVKFLISKKFTPGVHRISVSV